MGAVEFNVQDLPQQATASTLGGPAGISVDNNGSLYVAASRDNRVLAFPLTPSIGGTAKLVLGQSDFTSTAANAGVFPQASSNSLSAPNDVKVDQNGNVFVADTANHRVLQFPSGAKTATRVWGQSDFVSNGINQVKPGSINVPLKMAIDYSTAPFALYVSDTANHRVLVWRDSVRFRSGDPADLVIGQPNLRTAVANVDTQGTPSQTSLSAPAGIVVSPADGTLYVADSGNHRVLRYPRPVNQSGRIMPDAVIGQTDFTSSTSAAVNSVSLNNPRAVALGPNGNLFVADGGNNRVLEFAAGAGNGASAIRVYGQPNMNSSTRPSRVSAQTLISPQGIAVDEATNLYVTDTGTNRVLIFPNTQNAPPSGMAATFVIGQTTFDRHRAEQPEGADGCFGGQQREHLRGGYGNNRVLIFPGVDLSCRLRERGRAGVDRPAEHGRNRHRTGILRMDCRRRTPVSAPVGFLYRPTGHIVRGRRGEQPGPAVPEVGVGPECRQPADQRTGSAGKHSGPVRHGSGRRSKDVLGTTTWPTALLNRQVVVNDELVAPIYFVGPGRQISRYPRTRL